MRQAAYAVRRLLLATVAIAALVGFATAFASAAASKPTITFVSPSPAEGATLTTNSVTYKFTYNRTTKQTQSAVCSLSGPSTSLSAPCDDLANITGGAQADKSYTGLANGDYTFTVTLTLTDGGTASAARHFSANVPVPNVYWANPTDVGAPDGSVRSVPSGGGPITTLVSGVTPAAVAVDSRNVYWADISGNDGTIKKMPLGGGGPITTLATGQWGPESLAVDSSNVYWVNVGGPVGTGSVNKVPLEGGFVTTLVPDLTFAGGFQQMVAVDGSNVYWINNLSQTVSSVPTGGGPVTTLATGGNPRALAVDGSNVYWVNPYQVNKVPVGGGPVTTLATAPPTEEGSDFTSVAVDSSRVYWIDRIGGTVNAVLLDGGPVTTLATGQSDPWALAVDGSNVYWGNLGNGTVNQVPLGGGFVTTLATRQDPWSLVVSG